MVLISYGMQRSASTFAFEICTEIANAAGSNQAELRNRLPEKYRRSHAPLKGTVFRKSDNENALPIEEIAPYFNDGSIYVIKTHSGPSINFMKMIHQGDICCTLSYRDPRDIAVSLLEAGRRNRERNNSNKAFTHIHEMEHAIDIARGELQKFYRWQALPNAVVLPLKFTKSSPNSITKVISDLLNVTIDTEEVTKKVLDEMPNFFKGDEGRYLNIMSKEELRYADKSFFQSASRTHNSP